MKTKSRRMFDLWDAQTILVVLLYVVFLIYPIANLLKLALFTDSGFTLEYFQKFFSQSYYSATLKNSFVVSTLGTVFALIIGTLIAYFFTMYSIAGKKTLRIFIILASMSAPFIGAYSWILLLGRNGVITNFFADLGIQTPEIYGVFGIVLVFTLQLYPLIFLMVGGSMKKIDMSLLEAAENMGVTGFKRFYKVILPLVVPTLLSSSLLVFMRALADFGTPMLIGEGYRTFPVLIFNEFVGEVGGSAGFASAISIIAVIITTIIFLIQKYIANRKAITMHTLRPIEIQKPKGVLKVIMHLFIYIVVLVSILPQVYIMYTSFKNTSGMVFVEGYSLDSYRRAFSGMSDIIWNTIRIPFVALILTVAVGVIIAYLTVRRSNVSTGSIDIVSMIPYIIPGTVMGIAFLMAFNNGIADSGILAIGGTTTIMVIALVIRRLPYSIRSSVNALQQIPMSTEEAAYSLGSSKLNTFIRITIPMMLPGIIAGAILSWITMISELSTAILLYTVRTQTMTIAIYTQVIRGNYGVAGALSTILTLLTVLSLLILNKVGRTEDITM
ncbi:iron ABC transporter permease [Proteiniclasticum sp. SCR006]|uniref:Iron ABC transporter permease n=2 Tax=Proteiniclasticum aestuarii TaxID=2817862 RepID=A0A939HCC3_9CLOT|nr:iron ABC transporter permease [Proteiniclasticum aestuarii]